MVESRFSSPAISTLATADGVVHRSDVRRRLHSRVERGVLRQQGPRIAGLTYRAWKNPVRLTVMTVTDALGLS